MRNLFIQHKDTLNECIRYGILRADVLDEYGLYGGKLGMAILFYELSRYNSNMLFKQFADELVDSVLVVPDSLTMRFDKGLCGICWGIIYLLKEKFVEGNVNDVLIDLDRRLITQDLDLINEDNKLALLTYIQFRCSYSQISTESVLFEYINTTQFKCFEKSSFSQIYSEKIILNNVWKTWMV